MPFVPVTQCAAVTSRFPRGLLTTLAVQKCAPSRPWLVVNSAPMAGVPANGSPVRAEAGPSPTAFAMRAARLPVPPSAGVAKRMAAMVSTEALTTRADGLASHRNQRRPSSPADGPGSCGSSVSRLSGRMACLFGPPAHLIWFPLGRYRY